MTHLLAVNAAAWPFPFGYLYRQVAGNEIASVLAFAAGWALKGRKVVNTLHARHDDHAAQLDALFRRLGIDPEGETVG